jgi:hypothetical protein
MLDQPLLSDGHHVAQIIQIGAGAVPVLDL